MSRFSWQAPPSAVRCCTTRTSLTKSRLAIGDKIIVRKAGEIIPEVVAVAEHCGQPVYRLPEFCPSCHTRVVREEGQAAVYCPNIECPGAADAQSHPLCIPQRHGHRRTGVRRCWRRWSAQGWSILRRTLYQLEEDKIARLERMGKKSAANLMAAHRTFPDRTTCRGSSFGTGHPGGGRKDRSAACCTIWQHGSSWRRRPANS